MHNLIKPTEDPKEWLNKFQAGLHKTKKKLFNEHGDSILNSHLNYNNLAKKGSLADLKPLWDSADASHGTAYSLYNPSSVKIQALREHLEKINGNKKIICPVCGLTISSELDHFAPRSIFPEFAIHTDNLIPLCHSCNNLKSEEWLDENDRQKFFNAYFDTNLPREGVVEFELILDGGVLTCKAVAANTLIMNIPEHYRVLRTLEALNILPLISMKTNDDLRSVISEIGSRWKRNDGNLQDFIDTELNLLNAYIEDAENPASYKIALYRALVSQPQFKSFLNSFLPTVKPEG